MMSRRMGVLASIKEIEIFITRSLNKKMIPSEKILGIARNYKGIVYTKI